MTERYVLMSVEKPTSFELQNAIFSFSEAAPESSADEAMKAGLTIIGEACALLEEGNTTDETISSLGALGLPADCAKPFVDKAHEIVLSNRQLVSAAVNENSTTSQLKVVPICFALCLIALIYVLWR